MFDTHNAEQPLSLPTELITDIFKHAICVDFDTLPYNGPSTPLTTPLVLGAVCSSWRSFVREMPSLWAVIILKLTYKQYNNQMDILDLFLGRSGSRPLEIYFKSEYINGQPGIHDDNLSIAAIQKLYDYGPSIAAFRKLVDQSMRWRRIYLCVMDDIGFIELLRDVTGKIPLLETGIVQMEQLGTIETLDMFEDAPRLKRFSISKLYISYILLPWEQLTSFHVDAYGEFTRELCLLTLSECTNLVECSFDYVAAEDVELSIEEIIFLPRLRSLIITSPWGKTLQNILGSIKCPALRQLHLSGQDNGPNMGLPSCLPVEDFINRSNCVLDMLTLGGLKSRFPIISLLERLPSLQTLILGAGQYHDVQNDLVNAGTADSSESCFIALLEKLEATSTASPFLPNLTELQYRIPAGLDDSSYPSFFTSRSFLQGITDISSTKTRGPYEMIFHMDF